MRKVKIFENDSSIVNRIYKQDGRVSSYVEFLTKTYGNVIRWDAVDATNSVGSTVIIYRVELEHQDRNVYSTIGVVLDGDVVIDCTTFSTLYSDGGNLPTDGIDEKLDRVREKLTKIMSYDFFNDKNLTGSDMIDIIRDAVNV